MELNLKGKRALVLGGSTGIGYAMAEMLIAEGAKVAIAARRKDVLDGAAKKLGATPLVTDLSRPGAGRSVVEAAIKALGGIDILITNTGGPAAGTFEKITGDAWSEGFNSLWMSVIDTAQAALPDMRSRKWGRIILLLSTTAKEPITTLTVSNGFRAGLVGVAKSLSIEVAADGITVNCILPGFTRTDRLAELGLTEEKMIAVVPAKRLGEPNEPAALAAFLASDRAAYITGQAIAVDGGRTKGI